MHLEWLRDEAADINYPLNAFEDNDRSKLSIVPGVTMSQLFDSPKAHVMEEIPIISHNRHNIVVGEKAPVRGWQ